VEEKRRTESLLARTEQAREQTPPRERGRYDAIIGKLSDLHTGLRHRLAESEATPRVDMIRLYSASSSGHSRSSSRASSRPHTPRSVGGLSEAAVWSERERVEALQSQLRSQSPNMTREERLRLELLMAKLQDRHKGLNAAATREGKHYEGDPEL